MTGKKRPSRRLRADARARMEETGEKYTAARAALVEGGPSYSDDPPFSDHWLRGFSRLSNPASAGWMGTDVIAGEDPRTLNGVHISKGLGDHYWVTTIYDDPHVNLEDDDEDEIDPTTDDRFRPVDAGASFDLTPTIVCSVNAVWGKGWRIQLLRRAVSSGNLGVIQSVTLWMEWAFPIDDAYLASAMALHECFGFLSAVRRGEYRLWKTPESGARALFPNGPVAGAFVGSTNRGGRAYIGTPPDEALQRLDLEISRVVLAWVDLVGQWEHWMHNWPLAAQFRDFDRYFAKHPDHSSRERFKSLRAYYWEPVTVSELDALGLERKER